MEYFRLLTKKGNSTGRYASRFEAHRLGLWHPAVHIWIIHPQHGLLLQRRADDKETFAGRWDVSCAGHLDYNEEALPGAVRELEEELGIQADQAELQFLFHKAHTQKGLRPDGQSFVDREFTLIYLLRRSVDINQLQPDAVEVAEVRFWQPVELEQAIRSQPEMFCPHIPEFKKVIKNYSKYTGRLSIA